MFAFVGAVQGLLLLQGRGCKDVVGLAADAPSLLFEIWICGVKLKREDFCKQCAVMKTEILCM